VGLIWFGFIVGKMVYLYFKCCIGEVFLNGRDIRSYEANERTKKIGFILQDPFLFTGTVRENILYGNDEFQNHSNDELGNLLKKMNLEKLLMRFNEGLETKISNGGEGISLGQKQLIAFMRAALRGPELLILDEATASLDPESETCIQQAIGRLIQGKTVLVIAHRLRTIAKADKIIVLDDGKVIEQGTHSELMEQNGLYKRLYTIQQESLGWSV
jgi:ATP-binding cassette subfamily B protein